MIKSKVVLLIISLFLILNSCYTPANLKRIGFTSVNNNVCKKLPGKVVLYAIFVDSKYTRPWSEYDIESTLDSINTAISWIEKKATEDNIVLDIQMRKLYTLHELLSAKSC